MGTTPLRDDETGKNVPDNVGGELVLLVCENEIPFRDEKSESSRCEENLEKRSGVALRENKFTPEVIH